MTSSLIKFFLFKNYRYFYIGFTFASTDVKVEKESLVYPAVSFISELGGSLGLFVGFSFLTLWDCFEYIVNRGKAYNIINTKN